MDINQVMDALDVLFNNDVGEVQFSLNFNVIRIMKSINGTYYYLEDKEWKIYRNREQVMLFITNQSLKAGLSTILVGAPDPIEISEDFKPFKIKIPYLVNVYFKLSKIINKIKKLFVKHESK